MPTNAYQEAAEPRRPHASPIIFSPSASLRRNYAIFLPTVQALMMNGGKRRLRLPDLRCHRRQRGPW